MAELLSIQEPIDASHVRDLYFSKDWQVLVRAAQKNA
jgi:hypothetical protein